ncbi:MAG: hypothetical protein LWY06_20565 [Firmicutes bacterium]|nr:hypothetical protein [Bacillota bacterium]
MKYQVLLTGIILLLCISFSSISCSFAVEEVKIGHIKQVTWRDNNRVLIIDERENRYRLLELSTDTQQIFPVYNGNFENSEFISFNSKGNVIAIFDYTNRILKVVENNKLVFISKDLNGVIFHPIKINAQNKDYLVFYLRKIFVVGNFVIIGLGRSYLDTWDPLPKGSVDIVVNWRTNKIFPHYFDLDDPDKANNWKAVYNGNYVDISDDTIYYNSFKSGLFQYFPETNTFSKIFEDNLNIYGIKKSKNLFVLADYKSENTFPEKKHNVVYL